MFSKIRHITRWFLGIIAMLILLVMFLVFCFPPAQRWVAGKTAEALSDYLHTQVTLDILTPSLPHHIMAENLCLYDQQGDTLLALAHVDASVRLLPLLRNKIIVQNAQLFGYDIRLVQPDSLLPANYQFLLDAFQTTDTTSTPLNLELQNLKFRNGHLRYDRLDVTTHEGFSPAHIQLKDLSFTAQLSIQNSDSLSVDIQAFNIDSFNQHFKIRNLTLSANGNLSKSSFHLQDFCLQLPNSVVRLNGQYHNAHLDIRLHTEPLCLSDFALFHPILEQFPEPQYASLVAHIDQETFSIDTLQLLSPQTTLVANAKGSILEDSLTHQPHIETADLHLHELTISSDFIASCLTVLADSSKLTPLVANIGNLSLQGQLQYAHQATVAHIDATTDAGCISLQGNTNSNADMSAHIQATDVNLSRILAALLPWSIEHLHADVDVAGNLHHGLRQIEASVNDATSSCRFHLDALLTATPAINFNAEGIDRLEGKLHIDSLLLPDEHKPLYINDLSLAISNTEEGHNITLNSDFAQAEVHGNFRYARAPHLLQHSLHQGLPTLFADVDDDVDDELHLHATLCQAPLLNTLLGSDITLLQPLTLQAHLAPARSVCDIQADVPAIDVNHQQLRHITMQTHQHDKATQLQFRLLHANVTAEDSLNLLINATASDDSLHTQFYWNTLTPKGYDGHLAASTSFLRDSLQQIVSRVHILPTTFSVAGTPWKMNEADVWKRTDSYDIHNINITNGDKHLCMNGSIADDRDSIIVNLNDIQIERILGLVKFKALDIAGHISGDAVLRHLTSQPEIGSNLLIRNLEINNGKMGDFIVDFGFGRKKAKAIDFVGDITEPMRGEKSKIDGFIDLGDKALDLKIDAHNLNIDFLNHFTKNFFNRLHARTTGLCNIFGTFRDLDLQGDMRLDTFAVTMDVCGSRYHALPGDSILLRPGEIEFRHVHILDALAQTDNRLHAGEVNGLVTHTKLRRFYYNIDVATNDILTFNKPNAGEISGIVFSQGNILVSGTPSSLDVTINATPMAGSSVVYDLTTPEATTNNEFIHFIDKDLQVATLSVQDSSTVKKPLSVIPDRDDTHVTINVTANPNLALKFKMGSNNSDNIILYGDGTIHAHYFNKGDFRIYGTYRVSNGTYQLSLQDIIRKDFQFQKDGTLVFGGDPNKAALNLKAIHTVSGVSLNDLTSANNFSKNTVRVNCILNIQGTAEQPQLSFDFDIPNVNEDEKQMVRTMINTEEDRNTQILYLLGLGRFYPFDNTAQTNQTSTAMQGLLSSTLSGQLNNILTNAIGNSNWNFGTTFSTGNLGWQDLDIEGMLSGRLFNNRLLVNGTFGYRNTPISNSNFIGDFDVQWFFTKSGHVSLKAYSETNDRYFTKTALTTQGVGFQVQKDFTNLRDLFGIKQKNKKK